MLPAEHHAEGFRYIVTYRLRASLLPAHSMVVSDWRQSAYVVDGQLMYNEYDISVLAKNDAGEATNATRMIGYSGEDGRCLTACYCTQIYSCLTSVIMVALSKLLNHVTVFGRVYCHGT